MRRVVLLSVALVAVFGLSGCGYNELTSKQQNVRGKWSNVESSLQRRADLIPNLVETAKMAGVQEQEVFGQVAEARSRLLNATGQPAGGEGGNRTPEQRQQIIEAANSFGGTVGRLLSLQESYPQLRSSELFMNVQTELAGTENRINVARQDFNAAVQDYNTTRNSFPTVLTAGLLGFKEEPYFQADPAAQQVPNIGSANDLRRNQAPAQPAPASNTATAPPVGNANR